MIKVSFGRKDNRYHSVEVSGHADFADYGSDIVCAGVTSALQLCANGITHVVEEEAKVIIQENLISLTLSHSPKQGAIDFLTALYIHLKILAEQYPDNLKIILTEV